MIAILELVGCPTINFLTYCQNFNLISIQRSCNRFNLGSNFFSITLAVKMYVQQKILIIAPKLSFQHGYLNSPLKSFQNIIMQHLPKAINQKQQNNVQASQKTHPQPKSNKKISKNNQKKGPQRGYHWSVIQQQRYVYFISNNTEIFKLPYQQRVKHKIQVAISKAVEKRNPQQCRSHHQKMMKKHGSIQNIIRKFSYLLQPLMEIHQERREDYLHRETKQVSGQLKIEAQIEANNYSSVSLGYNNMYQVKTEAVLKEQEEIVYKHYI